MKSRCHSAEISQTCLSVSPLNTSNALSCSLIFLLDRYCDELRDEVEYTIARLQEGVHDDPFAESSS